MPFFPKMPQEKKRSYKTYLRFNKPQRQVVRKKPNFLGTLYNRTPHHTINQTVPVAKLTHTKCEEDGYCEFKLASQVTTYQMYLQSLTNITYIIYMAIK
jgi:hypothetical protein